MKQFKGWDILEKLPDGWKIDKTVGTPLCGHEFITNGKSVLNGQKRALLKVKKNLKNVSTEKNIDIVEKVEKKTNSKNKIIDKTTANAANQLARKKFEEKLLQDIRFDLMVCEIEGWDKLEYIEELKNLINNLVQQKNN